MSLYKRPIRKSSTTETEPCKAQAVSLVGSPVCFQHDLDKPSEKGKTVYVVSVRYCDIEGDTYAGDVTVEAEDEIDAELMAEQIVLKECEPLSISVISSNVIKGKESKNV